MEDFRRAEYPLLGAGERDRLWSSDSVSDSESESDVVSESEESSESESESEEDSASSMARRCSIINLGAFYVGKQDRYKLQKKGLN